MNKGQRRYRYRLAVLLLECLVVVLATGLGYRQLALLQNHDREARLAVRESAKLAGAYRGLLALDRERAAVLHNDGAEFARQAREFAQALKEMRLASRGTERALAQRILEEHRRFAAQAAQTLSGRPADRDVLLRLDREAGTLVGMLERFGRPNSENLSLGLMHRELLRSAVVTVAVVSLITVLLLVMSFALLNRLSRSWAAAEAMAAADRVRTDFVSFIAHELRNSMTALQAGLSMLSNESLEPDLRRRVSQAIGHSVGGLSRLVLNLLTADRAGSGRLQPRLQSVPAVRAVTETAQRISGYHEDLRARLRVDGPEDLIVIADPDYLDLVLSNLVDNARKFSPNEAPIEISVSARDSEVHFSVRDHGPGIPPDRIERIFRLYEASDQGSGVKSGTGVGLYLCKALLEAQGGRIEVASTPGHGSVFKFVLPEAAKQAAG